MDGEFLHEVTTARQKLGALVSLCSDPWIRLTDVEVLSLLALLVQKNKY